MATVDVVGLAEVEDRLGLGQGTARQWANRHRPGTRTPFPTARWQVSRQDAYDWAEVVDWLATTGRLDEVTAMVTTDEAGYETRLTIRYDQPNRHWLLAEAAERHGVRSWDRDPGLDEPPDRPWMITDQNQLAAEVRARLLAGWTIDRTRD